MTFGTGSLGAPNAGLQFLDETGLNPLPAGIFVQVFNPLTAALIGTAWTQPGGYCAIFPPLGVQCTATFSRNSQAPSLDSDLHGRSQPQCVAGDRDGLPIAVALRTWLRRI